jgi:hypothetical protein
MKNERTANELMADYNQKEYEQRQAWAKVLGSSTERNSKLAAPAKPTQRKPVQKVGFFSRFFKVA